MLLVLDIDLDLKALFSFKNSQTCSQVLSQIEYIWEYKYDEISKQFSILWV